MRRITPHLWFDREAKEAVRFYTSLFPGSRTLSVTTLPGVPTPTGDSDTISWELGGHPFIAINAGPLFKFNPSISFMVNFDPSRDQGARTSLETAWKGLSEGGTALMPLGSYFFSDLYGWMQDIYGLSWQLILTKPEGEE
ncbi:MAG: VOC family protein, partial [Proteobacteria bacterium]|nr:VOC family protein [Pseudomonadota bacterium]